MTGRNRKRVAWVAVAAVLLALAYWGWGAWQGAASGGQGAKPALPVEAMPATQGRIAESLTVAGQVNPLFGAEIKAEIAGRVVKLNVTDGSTVKAGEEIIRLDDSVLAAQLAQASANLSVARNTAARSKRLLEVGAASKQEAEQAAATSALAAANVQLAKANLEKARIVAPFDGVLGVAAVTIGTYVNPGDTLTTLAQPEKVKVVFRLPEAQARQVAPGSDARVMTDDGEAHAAKVVAVDSLVDPSTRTVQARVDLDNADGAFTPGQFVRVSVDVKVADNAVLVPDMALVPQGGAMSVYVINTTPQGTMASRTTVEVGLRGNNQAQIISGLQAGQMVVTAGQMKLQAPLMPVKVNSPTAITVSPAPIENLPPVDNR
jgi:membrane fusion protein (multidrug efflux system)